MTDIIDLDPEESGEVEERSSRSPDPATREAAAGESPSEGLVRALQNQEKNSEQPVVPNDLEKDGEQPMILDQENSDLEKNGEQPVVLD